MKGQQSLVMIVTHHFHAMRFQVIDQVIQFVVALLVNVLPVGAFDLEIAFCIGLQGATQYFPAA